MNLFILNRNNSVANDFLRELRDKEIQSDRLRFRRNMERLGEIMAYEISKSFPYKPYKISTPMGNTLIPLMDTQPILITVMRAGLGYFQGFLNFYDHSDCGFIGANRKEEAREIEIKLDYVATPSIEGRQVILIDPMLATGKSFMRSVEVILHRGKPSHLHIAAVVSSPQGLEWIRKSMKTHFSIWTVAVDEMLDPSSYIIPGLGDAGDLTFGDKI